MKFIFDDKFFEALKSKASIQIVRNLFSRKSISQKRLPKEVATKLQCLTVKEAMELLRVSKPTIYQLMNSGELPYITLYDGGDRRIVAEDISTYLEKRRRS